MTSIERSPALIHQVSVELTHELCPICSTEVGQELGQIQDLRLGCRCCIHYECLINYLRGELKDREAVISRGGIVCPFGENCKLVQNARARNNTVPLLEDADFSLGPKIEDDEDVGDDDEDVDMEEMRKYFREESSAGGGGGGGVTCTSNSSGVYLIAEDDLSVVASYGKTDEGDLHPVLAERLQKIGCEPLTINEVNTFSRAIICGGWENVAVDDPEIVKCAQFAFESSVYGTTEAHFAVRHAKRQVVAGLNIDLIVYIYLEDRRIARHFRVYDRFDKLILTSDEELSSSEVSPESSPVSDHLLSTSNNGSRNSSTK